MTVYADNAATTQMSDSVLKAMMPLLTDIYGNPSSLHSVGQIAKEHLEAARKLLPNVSEQTLKKYISHQAAVRLITRLFVLLLTLAQEKVKSILFQVSLNIMLFFTRLMRSKEGFTVTLLDVYSNGIVKPEDVANAITDETCLVTIMTANNEIGTIQPIAEIGKICKEKGVLFHTDAVQAVGHIPVNVKDMNCDMLSVSAHKFHGPKGVGFLYARKGILLTNIIYGGAQERNKRAGTENMASIVGMATAIKDATDHLQENAEKVTAMRNRLIDGLKGIERSRINGDLEHHLPGTLNMCFEGIEGESLLLCLTLRVFVHQAARLAQAAVLTHRTFFFQLGSL